jgi:hypothetical protein
MKNNGKNTINQLSLRSGFCSPNAEVGPAHWTAPDEVLAKCMDPLGAMKATVRQARAINGPNGIFDGEHLTAKLAREVEGLPDWTGPLLSPEQSEEFDRTGTFTGPMNPEAMQRFGLTPKG